MPSATAGEGLNSYPSYRITHIVLPARLQRPKTDQPTPGHVLLTPENSDFDTATETATEVGFSESEPESGADVEGYAVAPAAGGRADESDSDAEILLYEPTTPARGRAHAAEATPVPRRDHSADSDWSLTNAEKMTTPAGWTSSTTPQPLAAATALRDMPALARTFSSDSAWAGSDTSDEGSLGSMMDSMTLDPGQQGAGEPGVAPFVSQYIIPLASGHQIVSAAPKEVLKHRVSFFEYLYG